MENSMFFCISKDKQKSYILNADELDKKLLFQQSLIIRYNSIIEQIDSDENMVDFKTSDEVLNDLYVKIKR
jgi:hypothetical protein